MYCANSTKLKFFSKFILLHCFKWMWITRNIFHGTWEVDLGLQPRSSGGKFSPGCKTLFWFTQLLFCRLVFKWGPVAGLAGLWFLLDIWGVLSFPCKLEGLRVARDWWGFRMCRVLAYPKQLPQRGCLPSFCSRTRPNPYYNPCSPQNPFSLLLQSNTPSNAWTSFLSSDLCLLINNYTHWLYGVIEEWPRIRLRAFSFCSPTVHKICNLLVDNHELN